MKKLTALMLTAFAAAMMAGSIGAQAQDTPQPKGGTVKGAAVGGVAGHMMGGHTKTGMAVGAAAGHHRKAKSQEQINQGKQP